MKLTVVELQLPSTDYMAGEKEPSATGVTHRSCVAMSEALSNTAGPGHCWSHIITDTTQLLLGQAPNMLRTAARGLQLEKSDSFTAGNYCALRNLKPEMSRELKVVDEGRDSQSYKTPP